MRIVPVCMLLLLGILSCTETTIVTSPLADTSEVTDTMEVNVPIFYCDTAVHIDYTEYLDPEVLTAIDEMGISLHCGSAMSGFIKVRCYIL